MSGDVQPRKRKDKKKKKDEASGAEELRGTAAAFGEGDVLMHSQQEHGTGGHWCAKIIFFSLLAVLVGLIGLIILENRGLSELEANSVESRYTGVLDGWLEDAPDDHHDAHTLELNHPDEEQHDDAEASDDGEQEVELEDIEHEPLDEELESSQVSAERYSAPASDELADDDDDDDDEAPGREDDDDNDDADDDEEGNDEDEIDQSDEAVEANDNGASDVEDDDDFLQHGEYDDDADNERDEQNDDGDDDDDGQEEGASEENVSGAVSAETPYEEVEESEERLPTDSLLEEEEYERQQEEQRREAEAAGQLWLKLAVGAALLAATHAVVRRARVPPAENEEDETVEDSEEATPATVDRRMTLLPEPVMPVAEVKKSVAFVARKPVRVVREPSPPPEEPEPQPEPDIEPEEIEEPEDEEVEEVIVIKMPAASSYLISDPESYSDEEDAQTPASKATEEPAEEKEESEGEVPDDVEIIDEEQLDEELEEEVDEEEISDVDDAELLIRLEAKYGRLPEPERYGQKNGGGNSMMREDEWPDEPSEERWREELDLAEQEMHRGAPRAALARTGAPELSGSARARYVAARSLDTLAEERKDNALLTRAIAAYLELLKKHDRLSDARLLSIAERTIDRIRFKGTPLDAAPAHRALARRFPDASAHRNQLVISYLMANRVDLASEELKEILKRWPDDRVALAHYGFVLKMQGGRLEEAVHYLKRALEGDSGDANEARFHYHLGDALLILDRREEALEVHKRAAELGHFKSAAQRSLYNVDRLTARPWWDVDTTPYSRLKSALESSWREILKEGEAARALYAAEKEGLRERGEWSQLDLFSRGREIPGRCARAPVTCGVVRAEAAAAGCRRGQVKFSSLEPGTHIRPHVGPTNCRLRLHLALTNTDGAYLRVHNETRQWRVGKVLAFDDSFEHEVWHNGTGARLVLIVDVWHPELTHLERRQLPAI